MVEQKIKEIKSSTKSKIEVATVKAVKDFWSLIEFLDEKANSAFEAYGPER